MRAVSFVAGIVSSSLLVVGAVALPASSLPPTVTASTTPSAPDIWEPDPDAPEVEVGGPPPSEPWTPDLSGPEGPSAVRAAAPPAPNEALGDTGAYTFQEFWLDGDEGDQAIKVNVGSGNLFIRSKMGELRGPGVPAVAYRVYNSQNDINRGYIGPWREDYMITGLAISSSSTTATYYDGTGARWVFTKSGSTWTGGCCTDL